ncbi:hypothetical protein [uncultured Pontibacter sp.]|uniref:hypothetical protein n=1 Tax=uncultured Pontibacter sp. TaxID=453356 RepID=UPI0026269511|nr:hypothetical protein [uncultured Pontibacter sp.]
MITPLLWAQTAPGPKEQQITDNICDCISRLDYSKVTNKQTAEKAFMDCFASQGSMILDVANERNVEITDQPAMRALGVGIGKNLMQQNCEGFMKLSMAMAQTETAGDIGSGVIEGRLKRIETKDFNYFVITDNSNKEKSFIWLRQFAGSDEFMGNTKNYIGKTVRISWQDIEVFVPSAKNYYNLKEVTELQVL